MIPKEKLIEVALRLEAINRAAARWFPMAAAPSNAIECNSQRKSPVPWRDKASEIKAFHAWLKRNPGRNSASRSGYHAAIPGGRP